MAFPNGFAQPPWQPAAMAGAPRQLESAFISSFGLACYGFLLSSATVQFLVAFLGTGFPLVAIAFVGLLVLFLCTGRVFRFLQTPFAMPWMMLLVWWTIAGFLGVYPGRSVSYLLLYALRIHLLPFIVTAIAVDLRGVKRVLLGVGLGVLVVIFFCMKNGTMSEDRFIIPSTSFENGNDLALHLLMMGSLFVIVLNTGKFGRIVAALSFPVLIYYVLKTGSRGNLLVLLILLGISFLMMPARRKIAALAFAMLIGTVTLPLLPKQTLSRLTSIFTAADQTDVLNQNAVDSTNARLELQRRAIQLTVEHPLLGVGPLNFEDAVEDMVRSKEGHKSGWQVSHNSYLQVSSETGVPGLVLYVWSILLCLRLNFRAFRKCMKAEEGSVLRRAALMSLALLLATITYSVGVLFCSIAYDFYLALLVALTAATHVALLRQEVGIRTQPPR